MGGQYATCAQRVDLLGGVGQKAGDPQRTRGTIVRGIERRKAPPMLLDGLHPQKGQAIEFHAKMDSWEEREEEIMERERKLVRRLEETHIKEHQQIPHPR